MSVIVTTFNRLPFLKQTLESVASQTYGKFEVVVMDDGSSDGTLEFLADLEPGHLFRFERFRGRERSYLRNAGVAGASGSLVAFLDDDDEWLPRKLERQVALAASESDAGMIYSFTTVMDADGGPVDELTRIHADLYRRQVREGHTFSALARSCLLFTSSVLVRREAFDAVRGFDESLVGAEDWDFYLRMSRQFRIAAVEEPLVRYRLHGANSTMENGLGARHVGAARVRAAERFLERARRAVPRDSSTESLMLRAIAMNHYWAGANHEALRFAVAAFKASPRVFLSAANAGWTARALVKAARDLTA